MTCSPPKEAKGFPKSPHLEFVRHPSPPALQWHEHAELISYPRLDAGRTALLGWLRSRLPNGDSAPDRFSMLPRQTSRGRVKSEPNDVEPADKDSLPGDNPALHAPLLGDSDHLPSGWRVPTRYVVGGEDEVPGSLPACERAAYVSYVSYLRVRPTPASSQHTQVDKPSFPCVPSTVVETSRSKGEERTSSVDTQVGTLISPFSSSPQVFHISRRRTRCLL